MGRGMGNTIVINNSVTFEWSIPDPDENDQVECLYYLTNGIPICSSNNNFAPQFLFNPVDPVDSVVPYTQALSQGSSINVMNFTLPNNTAASIQYFK
jgi:hypothetical protein